MGIGRVNKLRAGRMLRIGCACSGLSLASKLLHFWQSWDLDVQSTLKTVCLRFYFATMIDFWDVVIEEIVREIWLGARWSGNECSLRLRFHESHWVWLYILWVVFPSVGMDIVRVKISAIDESTINRMSIPSSIVLEGRFAEVSSKGWVWNPTSGLLELNNKLSTFSISFAWSCCVSSCSSWRVLSRLCPYGLFSVCLCGSTLESSTIFIFLFDFVSAILVGLWFLGEAS